MYQFVCYDDDTMIKVVLALQTLLAAVVGEKSKIGTVRETLSFNGPQIFLQSAVR